MADAMLQLGPFQFSVETAAYQSLVHSAEYRWAAQSRIGQTDALEFGGYGREAREVSGVILPHYRGGLQQLDRMRALAALGLPMPMVAGTGRVLGLWVIEGVTERQSTFAQAGAPLRQEFDLRLCRYGGSVIGGIKSFLRL